MSEPTDLINLKDLRPPEPDFTAELEWVLEAAFASYRSSPKPELEFAQVWAAAKALALTERIGARKDASELPLDFQTGFRHAQARAAAIGLLYEVTAREVAEVAARLETPVVFLKGLALILSGCVPAGARSFSDLDILVPKEQAEALFDELLAREFTHAPAEATEQHLPQLRPARGGSLEVHFALRGVQIVDNRPADFEDLLECNSLTRLEGFPGSTYLPTPSLMATHILVHGFQQHLLRPTSYPLFRMIADLLDIAPSEVEWNDLRNVWLPTVAHSVSARSLEATRVLCIRLRAGERPDPQAHPDASRLFHHLLAGSLNRNYAESLRSVYLRHRLSEAYRRGELGRYLGRKIRPLFGRPRPTQPA